MKYPNFRYEGAVWRKGYKIVAGVDEVGRGALAGPVVAGCVVFKKHFKPLKDGNTGELPIINDSKKLSPRKREIADVWIKQNALTWGIGRTEASGIDRIGIVRATNRAIREAIKNANYRKDIKVQYLLLDAFYIPYIKGMRMPLKRHRKRGNQNDIGNSQQTAIVKGDQVSFSIAAASIIAKVYRDRLMTRLAERNIYRKYAWDKNKGYGTLYHRRMLKRYGKSPLHRKTFCNI